MGLYLEMESQNTTKVNNFGGSHFRERLSWEFWDISYVTPNGHGRCLGHTTVTHFKDHPVAVLCLRTSILFDLKKHVNVEF